MDPLRIYIDNSVVGGCHDEEFDEESIALFDMAREGKVVLLVSDLVLKELGPAPPEVREVLPSLPQGAIERVDTTEEAEALRDAYLAAGVVGPARTRDALHVAIASVAEADMIVSWNFKHIVHHEKIRGFHAVNMLKGYPLIGIHSPLEVI